MIHKTKVIVLDFDNCIILDENTRIGSEEIKDDAWFKVFKDYKREELEPIIIAAKKEIKGGKGDRSDIIKKICIHFNIPLSKVDYYSNLFDKIVQNGIIQIGITSDNLKAISKLSKKFPLYINTATPKEQVIQSLKTLNILIFFKGVYGRPGTKAGNLREIIKRESINPTELLLVDDSPAAYEASKEVGCRFIGIHTARVKEWHDKKQPFPVIHSLKEIIKYA